MEEADLRTSILIPNVSIYAFINIAKSRFINTDFFIDDIFTEIFRGYIPDLLEEYWEGDSIDDVEPEDLIFYFPYDVDKIEFLAKKYDISSIFMVLLALSYYEIETYPDSYIQSEEKFHKEYYSDMLKIRQLLETNSDSPLFVKLGNKSVKIENLNGWLTKHLADYIEDYTKDYNWDESDDETDVFEKSNEIENSKTKKVGRPPIDVKRKYYQYCFLKILTIENEKKIIQDEYEMIMDEGEMIKNDDLRCLKEFMEVLGFEFNFGDRIESEYLKVMRTEIIDIRNKGSIYAPIYRPRNYFVVDYHSRLRALQNGSTYTSIDDLNSYKSKAGTLDKMDLDHLNEENGEDKLNKVLIDLYQSGQILFNPEDNPLKISR